MTRWRAAAGCALLLTCFAVASLTAVRTKSPVFDEPLHAVSAWTNLRLGDFRMSFEDPPLWHYWAELPNGPDALPVDVHGAQWAGLLENSNGEWQFARDMLYGPAGLMSRSPADAQAFIDRSRPMMTALGVLIGLVITMWAWLLGGPSAAAAALCFFAFDPNFLAHSPLLKADVPFTLAMLLAVWTVWYLGRRVTGLGLAAAALFYGASLTVKFSAGLLGPVLAALLLSRAFLPAPWIVFGRAISRRTAKVGVALALLGALAASGVLTTWAVYGFRWSAAADGAPLNLQQRIDELRLEEVGAQHPGEPVTSDQLAAWHPDGFTRALVWMDRRHLMPQAWTAGVLFVRARAKVWEGYLLGRRSFVGWWYYFPLAILFKTPLATLVVSALAVVVAAILFRRRAGPVAPPTLWSVVCVAGPPLLYLLSIMAANLNIGIRHVLPAYPFVFVGIGWVASTSFKRWEWPAAATLTLALLGLLAESMRASPNYLAFFNAAAGGSRGGLALLSDSNLDWGQDLPLLAKWQREHPDQTLFLNYFGLVEPAVYGIRYKMMPGNSFDPRHADRPQKPAVLAVSATTLQGLYLQDRWRPFYAELRRSKPIAVLGGTIYLYDYR